MSAGNFAGECILGVKIFSRGRCLPTIQTLIFPMKMSPRYKSVKINSYNMHRHYFISYFFIFSPKIQISISNATTRHSRVQNSSHGETLYLFLLTFYHIIHKILHFFSDFLYHKVFFFLFISFIYTYSCKKAKVHYSH
uniref:Uncharacterized protein n=1 Tax=Cacopsylla melanoneura TaxID=428564 RepID=A0A8D8VHN8_9HEMI